MVVSRFGCAASVVSVLVCIAAGCTDDLFLDLVPVIVASVDACETDEKCNDGVFCNGEERCIDGECNDGEPPCGEAACDGEAQTCAQPCSDDQCDDGLFCNGEESCQFSDGDPNGFCGLGEIPCFGDDICSEELDRCAECFTANDCPDGDECVEDRCVEGTDEPISLQVQLKNEGSTTVHMLIASESFGSGNRLPPGQSRTVTLPPGIVGDVYTFRVGSNGTVFRSVDCMLDPGSDEGSVTYTGPDMFCSGDLR